MVSSTHRLLSRRVRTPESAATYWVVCAASCVFVLGWIWHATKNLDREIDFVQEIRVATPALTRAWIEIDFGNGRRRVFEGDVGHHQYLVKPLLETVARERKLALAFKKGSVRHIGGVGTPLGIWKIRWNDKDIDVPLETLMIKAGDRYTFTFEKSER